jgi:23S rRNA pseudouridine1911/1915/1917 synthase
MTDNQKQFTVEQSQPGVRLDTFLRAKHPGTSRGTWQRLIEEGHVLVNGKPTKPTHVPRAGDQIDIDQPEVQPAVAQPEAIPLDILFEDRSLLVLNKAPGLVVHPAAGHDDGTLVNALLHHCEGSLSGIGGQARPGIVHRLDKETSGCLVVAKNDETHLALSGQFAGRQVKKIYQAIVCGIPAEPAGEIEVPIARHPTERKRMAVCATGEGRTAHTSYRILERLSGATWVEAQIHTGRTHQIRVHFQFLGHPVVGDQTYGLKQNRKLRDLKNYEAPRVMLHAYQLSFEHPRTNKIMKFQAPLPPDFQAALKALRRGRPVIPA